MDKINILNKRLKEVVEKFRELKNSDIDKEILEIYLIYKTKLSKKDIQLVLKNFEEFYKKLIKDEVIKNL